MTINELNDKLNSFLHDNGKKKLFIIICVFIFVLGCISSCTNNDTSENKNSTATNNTDWEKYYADNNIELLKVHQSILYKYGKYYKDKYVLTVVKIRSISSDTIKANTSEEASIFYHLIFEFDDKNEIKNYKEDDVVVIAGKVESYSKQKTTTLKECHIISSGDNAKTEDEELSNNISSQEEFANSLKAEAERIAAEKALAKKNNYISKCQQKDYEDIMRNPNNYKDQYIMVSGNVIQITEGLFNSIVMRVNDSANNTWYITYTYSDKNERKILNGDNITVYGKSSGTTSYTTVLGSQITIPSVKAKYID